MAESNLEIKVSVSGINTLGDLEKKLRDETKALKNLTLGTKEYYEQELLVKNLRQDKQNITKRLWTEDAKLRDSYFKTGEELRRRTLPLMGGLANTIQSMPSGIRGVTSQLDMLVLQFIRLSQQGGGAGGAVKALASSLVGPAGISVAIAAVTTGVILLAEHLEKTFVSKLERAKKSVDEFIKATKEFKIDPTDPAQREDRIRLLKDEEDRVRISARDIKDEVKRIELLTKANELEAERNALERERETIRERERQRAKEAASALTIPSGAGPAFATQFPGLSAAEQAKIMSVKPGVDKSAEAQDAFALKQLQEGIKQSDSLGKQFVSDLKSGITQSTTLLAQGFVQAFGLGQSLADRLIASLLGSVFSAGVNYLTGGLFSLVGATIPSGGSASSGPEPFSISSQRSAPGGSGNIGSGVIAETRVSGSDFFIMLKRAESVVNNRSMKWKP